jgi:hypothetical protein
MNEKVEINSAADELQTATFLLSDDRYTLLSTQWMVNAAEMQCTLQSTNLFSAYDPNIFGSSQRHLPPLVWRMFSHCLRQHKKSHYR